jgi:tRNA pseudouridine55 synthase
LDGVLLIDKPSGPTSSDVVLRVRRWLGDEKVGHTGTLDPLATGLLPLCLGRATRLSAFLTDADKEYRATLRLGIGTDSGDAEGKVVSERPVPALTPEAIEQGLATLRGEQQQIPPMHSAVKVGGKRLYELAHKGQQIPRAPRAIVVQALVLEELALPSLTLRVACSKGTYIRVLAEDLGERLGCGAHLTALRRLRSGRFDLDDALPLDALEALDPAARRAQVAGRLIPMERALEGMASLQVDDAEAQGLSHGRAPRRELGGLRGPVALLDPTGKLLALAEALPDRLRLVRVLNAHTDAID